MYGLSSNRSASISATSRLSVASVGLFISILLFGLAGCGQVTVNRAIMWPAEVNMAGHSRVLLHRVRGPDGDLITGRLREALTASHFTVLDQRGVSAAVHQEALAALNEATPEATAPVVLTPDADITGRVVQHECYHQVVQETVVVNQVANLMYADQARATMEVSFNVIDLRTGKTIAAKSISATVQAQSDWFTSPPRLPEQPLFSRCCGAVVEQFMRAIAPHYEDVTVTLYKIDKLPANDSGIASFQSSDYASAVSYFQSALKEAHGLPDIKAKDLAKLQSNLGAAYEFERHFNEAIGCYNTAIQLDPGEQAFHQSLSRCQQRIENMKKLKQQGVTGG